MNKSFLKECLKFNQDNLNHAHLTFEKYQEYSEKFTKNILSLPFAKDFGGQGIEILEQWKDAYKEGQINFKKMIDEGFQNIKKIIE
ncbi:MAG: hypothetical protein RBR53_09105 [Desulforegulaceae bacterium]|nr:hypothetical protein [Desulforegulaceae bacterium]